MNKKQFVNSNPKKNIVVYWIYNKVRNKTLMMNLNYESDSNYGCKIHAHSHLLVRSISLDDGFIRWRIVSGGLFQMIFWRLLPLPSYDFWGAPYEITKMPMSVTRATDTP
jgi:hypothetical protein